MSNKIENIPGELQLAAALFTPSATVEIVLEGGRRMTCSIENIQRSDYSEGAVVSGYTEDYKGEMSLEYTANLGSMIFSHYTPQ